MQFQKLLLSSRLGRKTARQYHNSVTTRSKEDKLKVDKIISETVSQHTRFATYNKWMYCTCWESWDFCFCLVILVWEYPGFDKNAAVLDWKMKGDYIYLYSIRSSTFLFTAIQIYITLVACGKEILMQHYDEYLYFLSYYVGSINEWTLHVFGVDSVSNS